MANLKDLIVNGSARILGTLYANLVGNASTATKLAASKTVQTNLASTAAANFDGSSNITPGVTGTLPVANGGTGQTSVANIQAGKDGDGNTISSTYAKKSTLATVATSGSYNDLSNKPTVDQTYNYSSTNAQSGTAIAKAGFIRNTATGTRAVTVCGELSNATGGTNVGDSSEATSTRATGIGYNAKATAQEAIQLGSGTNSTAKTLSVGFDSLSANYQMLDGATGLIPDARLSSNIARTSAIPTVNNATLTITQGGTTKGTFTANASGDVTIALDAGSGSITIDQTYNSTSANAQSGVAINGAKFVRNTATGTNALTLGGTATNQTGATNIGSSSSVTGSNSSTTASQYSIAIGQGSSVSDKGYSIAIGGSVQLQGALPGIGAEYKSIAIGGSTTKDKAIQLGYGTNSTANSFFVGLGSNNYQLLNGATGTIPYQRINSLTETRNSGQLKFWTGTRAQYDAITTKDANTLYNITDDTDVTLGLLDLLYPIGAIYIGTCATCPLVVLGVGTWSLVASDRVLQGAGQDTMAGDLVEAGLPDIQAVFVNHCRDWLPADKSLTPVSGGIEVASNSYTKSSYPNVEASSTGNYTNDQTLRLRASKANTIYGNSSTVQPPAFIVNIWQRIS